MMPRYLSLMSAAGLVLGTGCSGPQGPTSAARDTAVPIVRLRTEPYSFSYFSGMDAPARLVVRDALVWRAVWNQIFRSQSPVPELPVVDFSREMLVVVALGTRNSGGYSILVDRATEAGGALEFTIRSVSPGEACVVIAALTQPVDIARLARRDGPVRFREHAEVFSCH
ncbi:MAG: protease complex subunit PrcB family protein [Gemmatimonadaceae bacterium]